MQTQPENQRRLPPCRHLRSKEMFYQGDEEDACSSGVYWCARTQEVLGPDGDEVSRIDCCGNRPCYPG